jgi:TMEM175 potassium channel family protein
LDLPIPHGSTDAELWHDFGAHWSTDYFPLLLSYVVIAAFWRTHHQMFRHVVRLGPGIMPLNFAVLLMIVLLPFVTHVLGEDGDFQIGVVLYAFVVAAIAALLGQLAALLVRRDVIEPLTAETRLTGLRWAMNMNAIVFAVSIPIGFVSPHLATWSWLVLAVGAHLVGTAVRGRWTRDHALRRW